MKKNYSSVTNSSSITNMKMKMFIPFVVISLTFLYCDNILTSLLRTKRLAAAARRQDSVGSAVKSHPAK